MKGAKYIFGWSKVRENGEIIIPQEAIEEYHLQPKEKVIIGSGSKTSGGFFIARKSTLEQSAFSFIFVNNPELAEFRLAEGNTVLFKGRSYCWVSLKETGTIMLNFPALKAYGVKSGDYLLSIRGSNIGLGLAVRGPIIEEAKKHPEIPVFE